MGKSLEEVLQTLPREQQTAVEKRFQELYAEELSLRDLRKARKLTQNHIAQELKIGQESVSRLEKRSDLLLSTLRNYVAAMGGELKLIVQFPDRPPVLLEGLLDDEKLHVLQGQ
jgi:transcriptional regulator with XRE-family HTH domain